MNLQSLMGPGAWEHYRPDAPAETLAETFRQAMSDWDGATPDQRADALRKAGKAAGRDEICVMDHGHCTEESCEFYQRGCIHQEAEEER